MITEAVISLLSGVWSWFMGIAEWCPVPGWLFDTSDQVVSVGEIVAGTGAWLPWGVVFDCLALFVCGVSCALFIVMVRMVLSLVTGGGGSATGS